MVAFSGCVSCVVTLPRTSNGLSTVTCLCPVHRGSFTRTGQRCSGGAVMAPPVHVPFHRTPAWMSGEFEVVQVPVAGSGGPGADASVEAAVGVGGEGEEGGGAVGVAVEGGEVVAA